MTEAHVIAARHAHQTSLTDFCVNVMHVVLTLNWLICCALLGIQARPLEWAQQSAPATPCPSNQDAPPETSQTQAASEDALDHV